MARDKSRIVCLWACIPALQPRRPGRHSRTWFVRRHLVAVRPIFPGTIQVVVVGVWSAILSDRVSILPPRFGSFRRFVDLVRPYLTVRSCRGTAVRVLAYRAFCRQTGCEWVSPVPSWAIVFPHTLASSRVNAVAAAWTAMPISRLGLMERLSPTSGMSRDWRGMDARWSGLLNPLRERRRK